MGSARRYLVLRRKQSKAGHPRVTGDQDTADTGPGPRAKQETSAARMWDPGSQERKSQQKGQWPEHAVQTCGHLLGVAQATSEALPRCPAVLAEAPRVRRAVPKPREAQRALTRAGVTKRGQVRQAQVSSGFLVSRGRRTLRPALSAEAERANAGQRCPSSQESRCGGTRHVIT